MAGVRCTIAACLLFHLLLLLLPPPPSLGSASPDTERCRSRCRLLSYLPRSEKDADATGEGAVGACRRGCVLFSICHFVDASTKMNTKAKCESACLEAYAMGLEQTGCTTGCIYQLLEQQSSGEKASIPTVPSSSFSMLDAISTVFGKIVNSAKSFISSTWNYYLQANDGKVEVVQSQTEMDSPVPELQAPRSEVTERAWIPSRPNTSKPHKGLHEKLESVPSKEVKEEEKRQHSETSQPEHDFLSCMAKRSGLPRCVLVACLFLSIMVMIWLSCATLATAPEQHVKTQPLSINGDQEYMDDVGKLSTFPFQPMIAVAICPTEESEEAGPLPVTVDLDKTTI